MPLTKLKLELRNLANPEKAKIYQRFFKTAKGEYGEGDIFLGLTVPQSRSLAKKFSTLNLKEMSSLLNSKIHEERLVAILLLVENYKKTKDKKIVDFYLSHAQKINNWDLVDLSADKILGVHFLDKNREKLYKLARSKNLWEKRIAIISTFHFIKNNQFEDTLKISETLLNDRHDLIHKAIGWMLRELGKRDLKLLEKFLKIHYKKIPRTTLRYAIEKFPEGKRKKYLRGEI